MFVNVQVYGKPHLILAATVDYVVTSSDLTFNATTSSQTVTIPILDDNIVEGSETIIVTLTSTDSAAILNPSSASVTIEDDDGKRWLYLHCKVCLSMTVLDCILPPSSGVTIGFNPTTYSVHEDQSSVNVAVFLMSGILARDVIVSLETLNGTAIGKFLNNQISGHACEVYSQFANMNRSHSISLHT